MTGKVSMLTSPQTFPNRTEGSVKKHWYKVCVDDHQFKPDSRLTSQRICTTRSLPKMRFVFTSRPPGGGLTSPSQSAALLNAIREYEASKWKVIGQKVGKPAKVSPTPDEARVATLQKAYRLPLQTVANMVAELQACEQYAKEHFGGRT